MIRKCLCCEKEFEINNPARKYCYDCSPFLDKHGNSIERMKATGNAWKKEFIRLRGSKCQICGYDKCIQALEFHHINAEEKEIAINNQNSGLFLEKIKEMKKCVLVCANCHREIHYGLIDLNNLSINDDLINKKIEFLENYDKQSYQNNVCKECGKEISYGVESGLCSDCYHKTTRIVERPEPLELAKEIVQFGFEYVGRKYNVSGNAIKKWCKTYNIPHMKEELKEWYQKQNCQ